METAQPLETPITLMMSDSHPCFINSRIITPTREPMRVSAICPRRPDQPKFHNRPVLRMRAMHPRILPFMPLTRLMDTGPTYPMVSI